MGDRNWDFVLGEVHRARQERIAYYASQDTKLGILFVLSGALIALSPTLPWQVGFATVMFAGFAAYYASEGLRTRPVDLVSAEWAGEQRDRDLDDVHAEYMGRLRDQVTSLDADLADKAWCLYTTRLFLICALASAGLGVVVRAITDTT